MIQVLRNKKVVFTDEYEIKGNIITFKKSFLNDTSKNIKRSK